MKKRIALLLMVVLGISSIVGCGSDSESEKETTKKSNTIDVSGAKLMSDGTLTIGVEIGYPPFEDFAEDGKTPIGYDIDIASEVAARLGLKVNFINTGWDGIFSGIDVNYDCVVSAVTITDERKETMDFSDSYIKNYQAIVIPTGSDLKISSFNDLDGLTIAVQKETTSDILMSDYKDTKTIDVEIVANEKVTSCFTQLTNGEVDAIVVDSTVADGYIATDADKYTIIYKDEKEAEEFGIAFGKNSVALKEAVNKALESMKNDGFIEKTYKYWFGSEAK